MYGIKIRELRNEFGITQKNLAEKLGTTQNNISKYELEQLDLNTDTLIKLCQIFNVSSDFILGREDETGARTQIEGAPTMTTEERDLLRYFRSMTAAEKRAVFETAKAFYNNHAQNVQIVRI